MELKKILIRNLSDIKILLSITGGIFVSTGMPFVGHAIWVFSNALWLNHFIKNKDESAVVMYTLWQIQAIIGIVYWGLIA